MLRSKLVEPLATDTDTHQPNPGDLHSQFYPSVHSHIFCTILVCFNRNSTRPCSRRYKLKLPCGPELLTLSVFFNSRARLMLCQTKSCAKYHWGRADWRNQWRIEMPLSAIKSVQLDLGLPFWPNNDSNALCVWVLLPALPSSYSCTTSGCSWFATPTAGATRSPPPAVFLPAGGSCSASRPPLALATPARWHY